MSRRWRYPRSRRGVFYGPPQAPATQAAPSYALVFRQPAGRNARLAALRSRRGLFFTTGRGDSAPPRSRRYAVRLASVRHGKFFSVPLVVVAASAPAWVPSSLYPARRAPVRPPRRGRFYAVPLVGLAAAPPTWIAAPLDPARRVSSRTTRRGKFYTVPPTGADPAAATWVPPALDPARRQSARRARRGQFFPIPLAARPTPVPRATRPRVRLLVARRGHFWALPPRPVSAASWVPPMTRARRAPLRPRRRCDYLTVPVPAVLEPYVPAEIPVGSTRSTDGRAATRVLAATALTRDLDGAATTREDE